VRKLAKLTPLVVAVQLAGPLAAADFVVTRYDDPVPGTCLAADCSLREAVIAADADDTVDRILLSAGTYELTIAGTSGADATTGDLNFEQPAELSGAGAGITRIDANTVGRAITYQLDAGQAVLRGVTITGGDFPTTGTAGVHVAGSSLLIEDSELADIGVGTGDGGLEIVGGELTVRRTLFEGVSGACAKVLVGTATFENVTFTGCGGPELSASNSATVTCRQCTISDPADDDIEVTTFSSATISFENSVVVGSCFASSSTIASLGGNLESPGTTCGFVQTLDQQGLADPKLGGLGDNGGPTRTIAPLAGSAAIDAGIDAIDDGVGCLADDQRGVARPQDGDGVNGAHCDKGAVELSAVPPPTLIFLDGFEQGDEEAWSDAVGVV
jgi:CSLREA domain-containing protein